MSERKHAREIAQTYLKQNDPTGWFEALYLSAAGNADVIPWADLKPNPNLVGWFEQNRLWGKGKKALKVGCGLGDDAEELARRGFEVTAIDISPTAIRWCLDRFPESRANYVVCDLFNPPPTYCRHFDLVVEINTLQVLPTDLRTGAMEKIARFVAPGGTLLIVCRGREPDEDEGLMPWPLLKRELERFKVCGLNEISFEDFRDDETPPARRFKAVYRAPRPTTT